MESNDQDLKTNVERLIRSEPTVDASNVEVVAELGFVNLNGSVSDEHQKKAIEALVRNNSEAKDVFNYLVVRPTALVGDMNLPHGVS
jgi:osmotically-inducible protein OsmY